MKAVTFLIVLYFPRISMTFQILFMGWMAVFVLFFLLSLTFFFQRYNSLWSVWKHTDLIYLLGIYYHAIVYFIVSYVFQELLRLP